MVVGNGAGNLDNRRTAIGEAEARNDVLWTIRFQTMSAGDKT